MKRLNGFVFALLVGFSVPRAAACSEEPTSQPRWIPGEVGPEQWTITPADPTTKDVIHFSGRTPVAWNSCSAAVLLGEPKLRVDTARHEIELSFDPVSPVCICIDVYAPVCGLEGEFGPLEEGDWLFFSPRLAFSISFHVSHFFWIKQVAAVPEGSVQLTWHSQPGVSYTVWSCSDLASGDWIEEAAIVSNGLTTSWKDSATVGTVKFYRVQRK